MVREAILSKVEDVARAMYPSWGIEPLCDWQLVRAREVIEALRKPTTAMLYEGSSSQEDLSFSGAADVWDGMINEALK